jgi:membrane protease YdiL (CAAX protease family)
VTTDAFPPLDEASEIPTVDRSFDTAVSRMNRRGIPAQPVTDRRLRRLLGWETLLVLALFPLPATVTAIALLASHISSGFEFVGSLQVPSQPALSVVIALVLQASELAAAGMVLYLLIRSREGVAGIGLGGGRLRMDLALILPVWIFVQVIPQGVGSGIVRAWSLPVFHPMGGGSSQYLVVLLFSSVVAGVLEEIVVLGYLVRRLEQRGWSTTWVVVVAVMVRVSYHLYYGPGVIPIVLWATATVLFYLKVRRLLPFIICHVAWDTMVALGPHTHGGLLSFGGLFFLGSIPLFFLWRRWPPRPLATASPPLLA